ncbi:S-adenosyl-L-methionine-dependent methyltransferase [Testicularia cyperi]|uniref:S-adenosyl-L-methionine-dependent methyltransferase n=1 Tax=Testicularia cyperi TaxID=1882483 RepID=A0A317XXM6_9BASI|nr:S-adenosyl-L-methionine-dependent methyltransferase [Testicularia cyperi]
MATQAAREEQVQKLRKLFAASEVPNDPKAWDQAWIDSTTPWDANEPQPALMELLSGVHDASTHVPDLEGNSVPVSHVVPKGSGAAIVPGCGRGYDAKVFAERGLSSFGVDISSNAVAAANKWLQGQSLDSQLAERIQFVEADFFALGTSANPHPALSEPSAFNLAYDYTFLCAIPPSLRPSWAQTYTRLIKPGGVLISLVYPIQGDRPGGPPFSLSTDLVRELLGSQQNQKGEPAWKELADLEPKNSKETRVGIERVMVWRRL